MRRRTPWAESCRGEEAATNLDKAFDQSLTALARWRSGDADLEAVVEALEGLTRAVAGADPVLTDRYDAVLGDCGGNEEL